MRARLLGLVLLACGTFLLASPAAAAPWCGTVGTTDRPAVFGGAEVRVLYAIPTDVVDGSGQWAPDIWAQVERIDGWWRLNDPSRTLRFDMASFGCGPQVDLTLLRLSGASGDYIDNETRLRRIYDQLQNGGDSRSSTKYLVYYDGPVSSNTLCGQSLGYADGYAVAAIYVRACLSGGAPKDVTAAHELMHSLGATWATTGAPNRCSDDTSHVCDGTGDILYRYIQPVQLASFALDVNHDDYYAHSGNWWDVQDSRWLRHLDAEATLSVTTQGPGSVSVGDVACAAQPCASTWNVDDAPQIVAEPAAGHRVLRWTGACANAVGEICVPDLDGGGTKPTTAVFVVSEFPLTVRRTGGGTITGADGAIGCGRRCGARVTSFEPATLRAKAQPGWRFRGWSGACRGSRAACTVPMSAATAVGAVFVRR